MRAFVIEAPGSCAVREVPDPIAGPGEVLVAVSRVGLCGTDRELFDGSLAARLGVDVVTYPRIPGHEWTGTIVEVGADVPVARIGERVFGDTFVGCGRCLACESGRTSACATRAEIGVRGRDGAMAELLAVPSANAMHVPDSVSDSSAAFIEPLSNAVRALDELRPGVRAVLIRGAGTLGLLAARVGRARGIAITLVDTDDAAVERARAMGFDATSTRHRSIRYDGVIDLAPGLGGADLIDSVLDGGSLVITGFPEPTEHVALRRLVDLDLRVTGTLGAPTRLTAAAQLLASGDIVVDDLVGHPGTLDDLANLLRHAPGGGSPPKFQVVP